VALFVPDLFLRLNCQSTDTGLMAATTNTSVVTVLWKTTPSRVLKNHLNAVIRWLFKTSASMSHMDQRNEVQKVRWQKSISYPEAKKMVAVAPIFSLNKTFASAVKKAVRIDCQTGCVKINPKLLTTVILSQKRRIQGFRARLFQMNFISEFNHWESKR